MRPVTAAVARDQLVARDLFGEINKEDAWWVMCMDTTCSKTAFQYRMLCSVVSNTEQYYITCFITLLYDRWYVALPRISGIS